MNHPTKTRYKRYGEVFKRQAVERWLVSGLSGRQIAAELGINEQSLKTWKQQFKQLPAGQVAPTLDALQAENFGAYEGQPLHLPDDAALPELAFLAEHRTKKFRKA